MEDSASLVVRHFSGLEDPRRAQSVKHPLHDILAIAISAAISGIFRYLLSNFHAWFRVLGV